MTTPPQRSNPLVRLLVPSLWAVAVLCASVVDPGVPAVTTAGIDQPATAMHVFGYGGLSLLLGWAFDPSDRRKLLAVAILVTLYGAGIELLQGLLPYRTMTGLDAVTNAVGAGVGAILWRWLSTQFTELVG